MKLPSRVSRRFAATSWRFRPTPLQLFGIAICAAILAFLSWTNPPRPLTVDAVAPTIDSGGLGLTLEEWEARHGTGRDHTDSTARYPISSRL
ncbi:MAG: hypothetical protein AB7P40_23705, partial [Chloroflexota bacterium]